MKEVTLKVPDKKYSFFMELVKQLGFEAFENTNIPEEHKSIVRERIKATKPEDMTPWDEARKQFSFKEK
ncbi:MAG: hypothetical protein RIC95_08070 [Vicingaceae bacterium]